MAAPTLAPAAESSVIAYSFTVEGSVPPDAPAGAEPAFAAGDAVLELLPQAASRTAHARPPAAICARRLVRGFSVKEFTLPFWTHRRGSGRSTEGHVPPRT